MYTYTHHYKHWLSLSLSLLWSVLRICLFRAEVVILEVVLITGRLTNH